MKSDERTYRAGRSIGYIRVERARLRAKLAALGKCLNYELAEPEAAFRGSAPCHAEFGGEPNADWCQVCRNGYPIHLEIVALRKDEYRERLKLERIWKGKSMCL